MSQSGNRHLQRIVIIAGPNGAGKTLFARLFLAHGSGQLDFINADLIARGLSPLAPELAAIQAGKAMLREIASRVAQGQSFALETTLSGLNYARAIPRWRALGYYVSLVFLRLPTPDLAVARVKARAAQGGHDLPEDVIRRRFDAGWRNFKNIYKQLADSWILYDNAGQAPQLVTADLGRMSSKP